MAAPHPVLILRSYDSSDRLVRSIFAIIYESATASGSGQIMSGIFLVDSSEIENIAINGNKYVKRSLLERGGILSRTAFIGWVCVDLQQLRALVKSLNKT